MFHRLAIASLLALSGGEYFAQAQVPAECVDPAEASAATDQCSAQFETTECGGRNDSRGNCDEAIDQCDAVCNSADCRCTQTRTGCSSSISVTNCQLSTTYDIECKGQLDSMPRCVEGYTVFDTGGCTGRNELGSFRNVASAALCAEKCEADDSCVSFEYNPVNSLYSCQLSTSCDRFSLTVNKKGGDYLWYARDSKIKTDAPTPKPTSRPTTEPEPTCNFCTSGVTESDTALEFLPPLEDTGEFLTCGEFEFVVNFGLPIPCDLSPFLEEICCPSTGTTTTTPLEEGTEEAEEPAVTDVSSLYPDCLAARPELVGDRKCQRSYNKVECGFDGGDCIEFNAKYPECDAIFPYNVGDGKCSSGYNTVECGFDGGDCIEFNEKYPDCDVNVPSLVGNGECDADVDTLTSLASYNVVECGYDGGDCEPPVDAQTLRPTSPPSRPPTKSPTVLPTTSPTAPPSMAQPSTTAQSCVEKYPLTECLGPQAICEQPCVEVCDGPCHCFTTRSTVECVSTEPSVEETREIDAETTPNLRTSASSIVEASSIEEGEDIDELP